MDNGHTTLARAIPQLPHVVVLGAGFAGLELGKALRHAAVRVTVVDRHNYHLFQPLLYQVATSALEPADIAGPIRQVIRGENIEVLLAEAVAVDKARKCVKLADRELFYDYLVVATGSTHSYFGHNEWAEHARGLKTLEDAMEIRRRVLGAFEAAEGCNDPEEQRAWLTFAVVGAGPTGVELAGALAEIARGTKPGDFDNIDPHEARILLIEGLPRVLTAYSEELSAKALRSLERLGVTVQLNTKVTELGADFVQTDKERIAARTVLWAAGVAASPITRSLNTELDKAGRVRVTPELTLKGDPEVYVIGDLAALELEGKPLPGLAPVAMAQGKHAAKNIKHAIAGETLEPFSYWDRGSFAVIGRGAAVGVAFKRFQLSGFFAWLMWLGIHLAFLVGFRNRMAVFFNWAYVYVTRRRHAQIIVGAPVKHEASTTRQNVSESRALQNVS
ncbi:MAG TPA: NAD(P)/FAD-dependent oxidoreductase [Polyangiales bacterium]|nr:NAD(P)/FAD-dependent oxidoreductase [Polyangiales bacterium]